MLFIHTKFTDLIFDRYNRHRHNAQVLLSKLKDDNDSLSCSNNSLRGRGVTESVVETNGNNIQETLPQDEVVNQGADGNVDIEGGGGVWGWFRNAAGVNNNFDAEIGVIDNNVDPVSLLIKLSVMVFIFCQDANYDRIIIIVCSALFVFL